MALWYKIMKRFERKGWWNPCYSNFAEPAEPDLRPAPIFDPSLFVELKSLPLTSFPRISEPISHRGVVLDFPNYVNFYLHDSLSSAKGERVAYLNEFHKNKLRSWYTFDRTFTLDESVRYFTKSSRSHRLLLEIRAIHVFELLDIAALHDCPSKVFADDITFVTTVEQGKIDELFEINNFPRRTTMHTPTDFRRRHGRDAEDKGFELVLVCTHALFKSRKTLTESAFDEAMRTCKTIVRRAANSKEVRDIIGHSLQRWKDMTEVFTFAIPVLEAHSLAPDDSLTGASASSSALMAGNHDTLMKDLDRLNDVLLVARNVLGGGTQKIQNLAGESLFDQQVLKLIDLCVRVTARGYDGDAGSRTEILWGKVIGSYKKLLTTCLQVLYNLIQENEQRKLLLWLDLFANSKVANEYNAGTLPPGLGRDHFAAKFGDTPGNGKVKGEEFGSRLSNSEVITPNGSENASKKQESKDTGAEVQPSQENSLRQDIDQVTDSVKLMSQISLVDPKHKPDEKILGAESKKQSANIEEGTTKKVDAQDVSETSGAATQDASLFGAIKTERGNEFGALRTPQSAALTLQAAKDQLMARLTDSTAGNVSDQEHDLSAVQNDEDPNSQAPVLSDEDEGYISPGEPGDQERGLLTDIPLVLGPQEIEALPMIIQIGICAGQGAMMNGRDMQGMRCNILLAGDPGRNLLRELLIFIAAWDLQDNEMYFKYMMQIMEAILENGLMPYAYQTFAEMKDIVSPAQSMVIKILTQIFRGKQGMPPTTGKEAWTAGNVHADASRRVDIYIVRYIFTIFRQCIIPETCALIYLQGQIKAGHALPEDFPLNLWDMERVYEGVYQFLEFFAVLTESEEWKDLLVDWEIVSELVTLLRELEASIPKAPISVPQTVAEAQAAAQQAATQQVPQPEVSHSTAPAPISVERPFDIEPGPLPAAERPFDIPPPADASFPAPSPLSQTDSQDQDPLDAADPSDFEWRNLKKLVILVLSSLVWKSPTVQKQIRQYGGVEMVMACCMYDGNNPYIKEHAIMCLRFLLEGSDENRELVKGLEKSNLLNGQEGSGVLSSGQVKVQEARARMRERQQREQQEREQLEERQEPENEEEEEL
ncbi:hypothetical protein N7G274_002720 [Stereocaulon virgatum]|uniref:Ataxin-10 homolog n=1 Tax=Stereocaulon virgatum TaxID=373712 RepID=A0ABR4AGR1_9LECA